MPQLRTKHWIRIGCLVFVWLLWSAPTFGATRTWTGGGADNNWATAANWGGTAPVAGDDLVFPSGAARLSNSNNITAGTSFNSITISGSGYTLAGNSIALGAGNLSDTNASGSNTISLAISMSATRTFSISNAAEILTISGVISGASGLTKSGAGTLTLSGTNTYTGVTTINGGSLSIAADSGLGTAPGSATAGQLTFGGGTLATTATFTLNSKRGIAFSSTGTIDVASGTTLTYAGIAAGSGGVTKTSAGTLTLSGVNTYSGATTISGGTISVAADSGLGTAPGSATAGQLTFGGGTLATTATFTLSANRGIAFNSTGTIDVASGTTLTYGGIAAASGGLTKTSAGTLILSGANTYGGATNISAGTLKLGAAGGVPSTSAVTATGTFDLNAFSGTIGSLAGGGTVTNNGGADATLTTGGDNTSTTFSGVIQDGSKHTSLTKTGSGTMTLSGANTYTKPTTINGGTLQISADNNLGTAPGSATAGQLAFGGGKLATTATFTLSANRGIAFNSTGTIDVASGTTLTYAGIAAGSGGLTKTSAGTLTLSGVNTYSGITTINGGTISIAADSGLGTAPGSATAGQLTFGGGTLAATATFTLNANRGISFSSTGTIDVASGTTLTYGGIAAGSGGLTKTSAGTLLLSGANTYSGATTISTGTLKLGVANSVPSGSAVTVTGTFDLAGFADTIGSLAGGGTVTSSAAGSVTLTAGGDNTSTTFSGVIQNGSGTIAFTKPGNGTLTFSGSNTYTGTTTVSAGTLLVNGSQGSSNVSVNGATLGGTGTVGTITTTASGGTTDPATSSTTGILSSTTVNWSSGSPTFRVQINGTTAGSGYDQLNVTSGTINLTGTTLSGTVGFTPPNSSTYTIINNGGGSAITGTFSGLAEGGTVTLSGYAFSISYVGGSGHSVVLTRLGTGTTATWTGAVNNLWSNAGNWSGLGGAALEAGNDLVFPSGASNLSTSNDIAAGTSYNSITISGNGYTLAGNSIALGSGNLSDTNASGSNTISLAISMSATRTFSISNAAEALTISGVISGAGGLTQTGSGKMILSGSNSYSGATTISGGTLSISADTNLGTAPGSATTGQLTFGSGTLATTASFTLNANRGLSFSSTGTIDVASSTTLTYGGIAAGSSGFTKTSAGTLVLSGANTFTGATTINGGVVSIAADNNLGTAPGSATAGQLTLGGGTLATTASFTLSANRGISFSSTGMIDVASGTTLTYGGIAAGSGGLTKIDTGTLTLSGANTYTGATTISAGILKLGANNSVPSGSAVTVTGTFDLAGFNDTIGSLAGGGTVTDSSATTASTLTAGGDNTSTTFSGVIQDGSKQLLLTKAGTGTLTLSGANTYAGATTISAGTLKLGANNSVPSRSAVTVTGTLDLAGFNDTIGSLAGGGTVTDSSATASTLTTGGDNTSTTFSGVIQNGSGTITLTKSGTGTFTLSGANTYTGATTISAGTLKLGANNSVPSGSAVTATGTFDLAGFNDTVGSLAGGGTVTDSSATTASTLTAGGDNTSTTFSGVVQDGSKQVLLTKAGTGTMTLSGTSTYTGATTINGGTLKIKADNNLGTVPGSATAGQLTFGGGTLATTATFTLNSNRGISFSSTGTIDVASSTTLTYGGIAAGAGGLTKTSAGTLTLNANNSYSGTTTISAGTLLVNGSQGSSAVSLNGGTLGGTGTVGAVTSTSSGGTVSPGSGPGILNSGNVNWSSGAPTFSIEINGTTVGSGYDQLNVTGTINLTGATLSGTTGFTPARGTTFTIIKNNTGGSITGTFSGLAEGATVSLSGQSFTISYVGGAGHDVVLTASGPNVTLNDSVSPSGSQIPGTDLAYTVTFTNSGAAAASSFVITDPIPSNTDFKVGSISNSLGTTGLTVVVAYSSDGGATWTYTPVSGGGGASSGYDRNVTNVRWTFTGNLSQTSPNNTGSVSFTSKIR